MDTHIYAELAQFLLLTIYKSRETLANIYMGCGLQGQSIMQLNCTRLIFWNFSHTWNDNPYYRVVRGFPTVGQRWLPESKTKILKTSKPILKTIIIEDKFNNCLAKLSKSLFISTDGTHLISRINIFLDDDLCMSLTVYDSNTHGKLIHLPNSEVFSVNKVSKLLFQFPRKWKSMYCHLLLQLSD